MREAMQNLESIDCSTSVKFYVGAHFSARFLAVSAITNVFTQPEHEADLLRSREVYCGRGADT
ncbi:hypothetical protein SBG_1879 [Salmonella bongori NCTC 12419]|uniref:Uncharacterized protein n=1 Tax=Salmonella bongori (strain ATCC 43975 / DSM 13772 / NCTC 12419) TaxID=218493 RepID=A0A0K0HC49_SALBC|nr:hypothetical protein SBG_1879 [Salmonella bongori NCTC 12419]